MAYILKDATQGQVSVKLTDAGRKKLSEGKLNIELFQLGDSEYCYNCYNDLPQASAGIHIQQSNFNAQNLNPIPEKNKGHVKYPIPISQDATGTTFGAAQAAHNYQEVYNRASQRGFYSASTGSSCCSYSAYTGSAYTLNANFWFPVSAMTGGTTIELLSGNTFQNQAFSSETITGYSPKVGDLLSIRYIFQSGATGVTNCFNLPCTTPSAQLFYQVTAGNTVTGRTAGTWKGSSADPLYLTVDRLLPDFGVYSGGSAGAAHVVPIENYTGATGDAIGACVKVYPSTSGGTYSAQSTNPMLTYYGADTPIPYWSPGSLSFENNCDVSIKDVKVWNMNINWSETVAGVDTTSLGYENVNDYGSSGYCGTKEYLGYTSNGGQADTGVKTDYYTGLQSASWYFDSYAHIKAVVPERQKAIAILHYTNQTISNFYGEKLAMKMSGETQTGLGEARNFRINMPWLMWHKKNTGVATTGTEQEGCQGAATYGQCFYVDPPGYPDIFPSQPYVMQSTKNPNMNNNGLRYYYLWDTNDNSIPGQQAGVIAGPNPVGKVFPDLKMAVIHDEELVAAMSYKSNRSWTLPAPRVQKIAAGTNCCGSASTLGVFTQPYQKIYLTYLIESNSGLTTGLHCNYYIDVPNPNDGASHDLEVEFGPEFPYLKPFELGGTAGVSGGTGWQGNKIHLLWQRVTQPQSDPLPDQWTKTEVTDQIGPCDTFGFSNTIPFSGCQISSAATKFYLTRANQVTGTTYNLHDYINIPLQTTERDLLQFGDEYFFFGELESDIMATIYEMKYYINLSSNQFAGDITTLGAGNSLNPTYAEYYEDNALYPNIYITEIGLFNNENSFPELMAIAKLMNPNLRDGAQQFVLTLDF